MHIALTILPRQGEVAGVSLTGGRLAKHTIRALPLRRLWRHLPLAGEDQRISYPRTTSISSNRFHR